MKDFFEYQGATIHGFWDTTREAFQNRLIEDGEVLMNMIIARNLTSHAYDQINAEQALAEIQNSYHGQFLQFQQTMVNLVESTWSPLQKNYQTLADSLPKLSRN